MPEAYEDRPRIGRDELDALFTALGENLARRVEAWDIGGSPMVYRNLKAGTKDADLVVQAVSDRDALRGVLVRAPFLYTEEGFLPGYQGLEGVLLRKDGALGVDLFVDRIMEGLRLTPSMRSRAEGPFRFGELVVHHCANEDLFLLKAITHRPDDDQDILLLVGAGLDEEALRAEALAQREATGIDWRWKIYRALEAIEERSGVPIDVKSAIVE